MDSKIEQAPQWWDREFDQNGRRIRADILEAGRNVWPKICTMAKSRLPIYTPAAEIMESAIASTSRHLNKKGVPLLDATRVEGLVVYAVKRLMVRLRKRYPEVAVEIDFNEAAEMSDSGRPDVWSLDVEHRADAAKILPLFSPRGCTICLLRYYYQAKWSEIADYLGIAVSTAQNSFWKEVRQVRIKLAIKSEDNDHSEDREG